MKKIIKISLFLFTVCVLTLTSMFGGFAKGALILDDGVNVGYNDTVTYTLYISDCEKPVTDMVAYLFYDSEYLQPDPDSVDFHDLLGVNRNLEIDGSIPFNFSVLSSPVDFSEKTPIVSVDFKAVKEGQSSIQYFIGDLDGGTAESNSTIEEFTLSCDYVIHSADGDQAVENVPPKLLDDKEKMNEYQGSFINYYDGKGKQGASGSEHIAVTGETHSGITDVTKGSSDDNTTIIITVAVIVIILVIIIIIVLRRIFNSETDRDSENARQEAESENEREEG